MQINWMSLGSQCPPNSNIVIVQVLSFKNLNLWHEQEEEHSVLETPTWEGRASSSSLSLDSKTGKAMLAMQSLPAKGV